MKLIKLNLDIYKCKELKKTVENIELEWGEKKSKISDFELRYIIENLLNKSLIKTNDILKIFYNIGQVKIILKEKYSLSIEEFLKRLEYTLENESIKNDFFNLDIFYDSVIIFYKSSEIQNIIFSISDKINKLKDVTYSKKTKLFLEMKQNNEKVVSFLSGKFLKDMDKYLSNLLEYELEYYIDKKSELFYDIIENIIRNYIEIIVIKKSKKTNEVIKENFKRKITNYSDKIELYKKILNAYFKHGNFNENTNMWFYEILDVVGDIQKKNNSWLFFNENEKNIFSKWFFQEKLDEFFGKEIKDPERAIFWKSYAYCLKNIDYYEKLAQTIVMEFENHTVIEFGKKGNATYVYPKKNVNSLIIRSWYNNNSIIIVKERLKNWKNAIPLKQFNISNGWNHSSNWQTVFKYRLSELGYRAEGRIWTWR